MTTSLATPKKLTPMMEQYRSIKKTLPTDTILFFRLGDFYEMFFEDAIRSSEILDITLTGRGGGEARIPMCGIPYHASANYIRTLVDANLKVAICEQVGDPKASKGLVERKVTRIISPATYLEDDTTRKNHEYMVSVSVDPSSKKRGGKSLECAIACLELSTGEFYTRKLPHDRLMSELLLLKPREVILPRTLSDDVDLTRFMKDVISATVTVYEDWIFERNEGMRLLVENFKLASEKGVAFYDEPFCVSAAGGIIYYLRDHLHESLDHVQLPQLLHSTDVMILDRQTQRSLELVRNQQGQSGTKSSPTLLSVLDQTMTSMGSRVLYQWVTQPLLKQGNILKRQEAVKELVGQYDLLCSLKELLRDIKDIERTLSRLNYGVANARDLLNLRVFLGRIPDLKSTLANAKTKFLEELNEKLSPFQNLNVLIENAICEEPPLSVRDGGLIQDGYSADLDELRSISKNGKSWILEFEKRESQSTGIKSLKVKYSQVFGYTIEVSKSNLQNVPEHYIRRQTLANAERFVVPELKEWDEKISGAQDKIKALEFELFSQIREVILKDLGPLQAMARAVGILDCLASLSSMAHQNNWVCPSIAEDMKLHIEGGRHPVVEAMLPTGDFVENDVKLDDVDHQLIVLTGPNMAGKSTYIRQVAHVVLLAQMGSFVPAKVAKIGIVDRIFTRIGASDDLAHGESTFMVEMLETAHILQSATDRSLLILDEVGRGTSTFDGVSIAWAICEHLSGGKVNPRTLFATHYHELTQLEEHFPKIKNYNILVKDTREGIVFLRKVAQGKTDRSYGIHVARLAGLPESVTRRADKILKILESENTEATQIIEGKSKVVRAKKELEQPTLFDMQVQNHPVIDELEDLHVDQMTPLEALNLLSEWKQRLKDQ